MSNYIYYNGELYHHGVKGMKWGVRKANKQTIDNEDISVSKMKVRAKKARYAERVNLRRASGAITEKRKNGFAAKAEQRRREAEFYKSKIKELESDPEYKERQKKGKAATTKTIAIAGGTALASTAATVAIGAAALAPILPGLILAGAVGQSIVGH